MALLNVPRASSLVAIRRGPVAGLLLAAAVSASPAAGQLLTQAEALSLAFDGARIERRTAYLEDSQLAAARELAGPGVAVETGVVTYYLAFRNGGPVGVAYFDAHRVRTMEEVLMITVARNGTVGRIETVAFREPPEYRAPEGWLDLFEARSTAGESPVADVPNIAGATLTADAVKRAARRALALHRVIAPFRDPGEER